MPLIDVPGRGELDIPIAGENPLRQDDFFFLTIERVRARSLFGNREGIMRNHVDFSRVEVQVRRSTIALQVECVDQVVHFDRDCDLITP